MTYLKLSSICLMSTLLMLGCVKKEEPQAQQEEAAVHEEVTPTVNAEQTEPQFTQLIEVPNESDQSQSGEATITDQDSSITSSTASTDVAAPAQTALANQPHDTHSDEAATEDDAIAAALKAAQPALQQ